MAEVIIFVVVHYVMVLRQRIAIKKGLLPPADNLNSIHSDESPQEGLEDWQEIEADRRSKTEA